MRVIKVSKEDIITRINGLFSHRGEVKDKKSSYGEIIDDIIMPKNFDELNLKEGEIYSFKTLENIYYECKRLKKNKDFIAFFETIIGLVNIPEELKKEFKSKNIDFKEVYNVNEIDWELNRLKKLQRDIFFNREKGVNHKYKEHGKELEHICCLYDEYNKKGGLKKIEFLDELAEYKERLIEYNKSISSKNTIPSIKINVMLKESSIDLGAFQRGDIKWNSGIKYRKGDIVEYGGESYVCIKEGEESTTTIYDSNLGQQVIDLRYFRKLKDVGGLIESIEDISGVKFGKDRIIVLERDSVISEFRKKRVYYNEYDIVEKPTLNKEWLYYYRLNNIVNQNYITDNDGNIGHFGNNKENGEDLMLYGSGISKIEYDEEKRIIKVEYFINAHLKGEFIKKEIDKIGREKFYFDNYEFDVNQYNENEEIVKYASEYGKYQGLRYIEYFKYEEGGEIDRLIKGEEGYNFKQYISGEVEVDELKRYEMERVNTDKIRVLYYKKDLEDYVHSPLIREDFLVGIQGYNIDDNVFEVSRGEIGCFEKHMKLGEVRSIKDMDKYSNGSYFKQI